MQHGYTSSEETRASDISNHLVRFAIQLISNTCTNRDYSMVCISVYGRRGSFFNISCTKTLFCPEISLVRSDSHSLTLPLSSDTSQVAFHSVQHSAFSSEVRTVSTLPLYFCISLSKYGSKYPNFFYAQGDIPPVRIPMTS